MAGDNMAMARMQLQDILFSQGFGTRRVCAGLVQQGFVTVAGFGRFGGPMMCAGCRHI
jgi:hypothetical protein